LGHPRAGLWYQQFGSPITVATTASTRLSEQDGAKTKHPARVTNVDGEVADPPTLPESIDVDVVSTPYTTSETVITTGQPAFLNKVDVEGLVRGTGVDPRRASLRETTVHQSELTLTPQETTAETVTVEVKLLDANTGDPIQTANRNGTILLQNQSIETNAAGTTVVTVPRPVGALTVRYEPARGGRLSRPISKARIRSTSRDGHPDCPDTVSTRDSHRLVPRCRVPDWAADWLGHLAALGATMIGECDE